MTLQIRQAATPNEEGWWDWAVWLDGSPNELNQVDYVEYVLHPTFPNPVKKVNDRGTNFRLQARGWGEFNIKVRLHLDDDEVIMLEHWLELDEIAPTRGVESYSMRSRYRKMSSDHPLLFVSSAMADMKFTYALKSALEEEGLEVLMGQDLDDDQPLEIFLETQRRSIQAGLFVVSDIRNPSLIREYWVIQKSKISSMVVQIGDPRDLPDEMEDLPRFQVKDVSETEFVAASIAQRVRDRL